MDYRSINHLEVVTKSDTTTLSNIQALWIGTAGHITLLVGNDTEAVQLKNVGNGEMLRVNIKKVTAATTAEDIVGIGLGY